MIFGLFSSRKTVDASDELKHFEFPPKQQHTPSSSLSSSRNEPAAAGPVDTPSPVPDTANNDEPSDPSILHALIASVPPQTLHAYTLAHLSPAPPSSFPFAIPAAGLILHGPPPPPSPQTISVLSEFFANLTPPPKLHCVRCHKGYFELENSDRSCLVHHDDDSATVDRVRTGLGTEFETLWSCCGRTVEGDGDQGPPDGWCYEGRHTTDPKRARFRADSTPLEDKLVSCIKLRCGLPPLPPRRKSRKRTRVDSHAQEPEETPSVASSSHSRNTSKAEEDTADKRRPSKRPRSRKGSSVSMVNAMDVDERQPSPPKSKRKAAPASPKPRSKTGTTVPLQKSPLSSTSFTAPTAPISRPTTPSRKVQVEIVKKSPSKKKMTKKTKQVGEVVETSVDGEAAWN